MTVCRVRTSCRRRPNWEGESTAEGWPGSERNCRGHYSLFYLTSSSVFIVRGRL